MKLKSEYEYAVNMATSKFTDEELYQHVLRVIKNGRYNHLDVRIAHDLKYATMPSSIICKWYDKYNCNDDHITTLYKKVIKDNYPMTWETIVSIQSI